MDPIYIIFGAGGHARMVLAAIGKGQQCLLVDDDEEKWGTELEGVAVIGLDEAVRYFGGQGFMVGIGSVAYNPARRSLWERALAFGLKPLRLAPFGAQLMPGSQWGSGTFLGPGSVLCASAKVGDNVIINTRAVVEHDAEVGDHSHIATGVILCGGVKVGVAAHVGAGAMVKQGVEIGDRAVVGMGAVVLEDVPSGKTVVGNPARDIAT